MQSIDGLGQQRIVSLPSLIAWMSLCILAAAWGRSLDEVWQPIWADVGAFGLIAAVGLSVLERGRIARQRRAREHALESRAELGLARLNEQGATRDAIQAAIRCLRAAATSCSEGEPSASGQSNDDEQLQRLSRMPTEITPVIDSDNSHAALGEPMVGSLRKISPHGFVFFHERPLVARIAVLTFRLGGRECLSFVVDVLWTESSAEGFTSGGAILDVGVPAHEDPLDESTAVLEACAV